MKRYMVAYIVMLALFPAFDLAWFAAVAHGFYQSEIGGLLAPGLSLAPAVAFYGLYAAGALIFVVAPALDRGDVWRGAGLAAVYGLVAYGAYDLTNLATLKGFTLKAGLVDMAWGAVVTAVTAGLSLVAARAWGEPHRSR